MAPNGTDSTRSNPVIMTSTPNTITVKSPLDSVDSPPTTSSSSTSHTSSPAQQRPSNKNWQTLNLKKESDRRKTYERWPISFMDPHRLSAAGFYYMNQGDIVKCAFCGVEVGRWEEGDDPFRDHQRWAPSCGFVRGLPVGNIPISPGSQPEVQPSVEQSHGRDVCGPFLEMRPFSGPERGVSNGIHQGLMTAEELQKYGINQSRGPMHPAYNTYESRLQSYESWPRSLKQKPDELSEAGFYYTGKGDQTVCFYCGGGLKDWEETDDPWVEHAIWFPKCTHVVLIKGRDYPQQVRHLKDAKLPATEVGELLKDVQNSHPASASNKQSSPEAKPEEQPSTTENVIHNTPICKICFTEECGVLFLPCGHIVACVKCAPSLSTCAVCREPLAGTIRAFFP